MFLGAFHKYQVEIFKNIKFVTPEGLVYPNTASISFLNQSNDKIAYFELGYLGAQEIYEKIYNEEELNLSYCYIKNFSLTAYRKYFGLPKKSIVKIKKFKAHNSFFHSYVKTDFSYAFIEDGHFEIENSFFLKGDVLFNNVKFGDGRKNFSYIHIKNGNLDFSGTDFGNGDVLFKNSRFSGDVLFHDSVFGEGLKDFSNVDFGNGNVLFINTKFGDGRVVFKIANFGNGLKDFHFSTFGRGNISFEKVNFNNGDVNFSKVEFGTGKINFNRASFGLGLVTFEGSELKESKVTFKRTIFGKGKIDFSVCNFFSSNIIFDKADLSNTNLNFGGAKVKFLSFKHCNIDKHIDLRVKYCGELDMSDTFVRDIVDFMPTENDVLIEKIRFVGMRLMGVLLLDWNKHKIKQLITNQEDTNYLEKSEQFRILKKNFADLGRYYDEDKAYLEFKRYEEKAKLSKVLSDNKLNALWYYPLHLFKVLVFDKMGHYATNPLRVLSSMFVVYSFFSLIYILLIFLNLGDIVSGIGGEHSDISVVAKSFFFAAITFLTIGYGDFYPMGIIRGLSAIEGFIGVFLMSYFTVAFVRKILR